MKFDQDTQKWLNEQEPHVQAAIVTMTALGEYFTPSGDTSPNVPTGPVIEGCTLLIAGMIEAMPDAETSEGLARMIDAAASSLKKVALSMRKIHGETGARGMEQIGLTAQYERGN